MACAAPVAQSEPITITVLLVGKTGAGKSCLGNRLLGYSAQDDRHPPFKVSADVDSETSDMKMVDGFFCGEKSRQIRLIDCPGLADSKGRDDQFAPMLSRMMKRAGLVNVLLWCRNGQEDRIDINEWHQLATCRELFGAYLFENMVMNLSKWAHDAKSDRRRQQSGKSFLNFRNRMWEKVTNQVILGNKSAFPIFSLDAMYDVEDDIEVMKFNEIKEEMWKCFMDLASKPVFTKEVLQQQIEKQKAEEAKTKREKEEEERKKIEAAVNNEVEKVKTEQKVAMKKLQDENQRKIDARVRAVQEEQERARKQAENTYQRELNNLREEQGKIRREAKEEQARYQRQLESQERALKEAEAGAKRELERRMQMLQEEHEKAKKNAEEKEKEHQRQLREKQRVLEEEQEEIRKQAREREERARREAEENMERVKREQAEEMERIRRAAANEEKRRIQEEKERDREIAAAGQRSKEKRSWWVTALDIATLGVSALIRKIF